MNINTFFVRIGIVCLVAALGASSCKKKRAFKEENGLTAEDIRYVQAENSEAMRDVNVAIMEQSLLRGRGTETSESFGRTELCGVDVDTVLIYKGFVRLLYNGTFCNGISKTGKIEVTIQDYPLKKWKHANCVLKIEFLNYKVMYPNGRSVQLDGIAYLTNVSGNTWYEMRYLNASTLVQKQTSDKLKVTYEGMATAIFNFSRRITYNYSTSPKIVTTKIEGTGSSGDQGDLDNWGENRDGYDFTTQLSTPLVLKSSCDNRAPIEGEAIVKVDGKSFDMKCRFGVDQDGNVAGADACPYGWKLSWSYKRRTNNRIFEY